MLNKIKGVGNVSDDVRGGCGGADRIGLGDAAEERHCLGGAAGLGQCRHGGIHHHHVDRNPKPLCAHKHAQALPHRNTPRVSQQTETSANPVLSATRSLFADPDIMMFTAKWHCEPS